MKKLITFTLLILCVSVLLAKTDFSSLDSQLERSIQDNQISSILSLIIEVEKPTPYQRAEMIKLENTLYRQARQQKFSNFAQMAKFLNERMPEVKRDTILIKDAFPVAEGELPKGYLDCDGKSLYALGVLERLGNPFQLYAVSQIDHMLLTDGKLFYDLLYGQYGRQAQKNEWSYSFPLLTKEDIHGHLLGNMAIFYWKGGGELFYPEQEPYIMKGFDVAESAYQKNPKNVSLILNWYKFLSENKRRYTFPQLLEALGHLIGRSESNGLYYRTVFLDKDFYSSNNPQSKILKKKIEKAFTKNKWIPYTLQRIAQLYGLHAEKFVLEVYMDSTPDLYGENQRSYACVLHALGYSEHEVLRHRTQANEKFRQYVDNIQEEKLRPQDIYILNMINRQQVNVSDNDFLRYCQKTFRSY